MQCIWCEAEIAQQYGSREHLLPQSKGGSNAQANIAPACSACNNKRGSITPVAFVRKQSLSRGWAPEGTQLLRSLNRLMSEGNKAEQRYATKQYQQLTDWLEQTQRWGLR